MNNKYAPLKWDGSNLIDENTSEILGSWIVRGPYCFIFNRQDGASRSFVDHEKGKRVVMDEFYCRLGYLDKYGL